MKKILIFLISLLLVAGAVSAYEVVESFDDKNAPVVNDELRDIDRRLREAKVLSSSDVSGVLPLSKGGTGEVLTDPGADRIMFWDDDQSDVAFLTPNTGIEISGTNLNVTMSQDFELVANNSFAGGDSISSYYTLGASKVFRVILRCTGQAADLSTVYLRFASDGGNYYSSTAIGFVGDGSATKASAEVTGGSYIKLNPTTIDVTQYLVADLMIYTSATTAHVTGTVMGMDTSNDFWTGHVSGYYSNLAPATIAFGAGNNIIGNLIVYELSSS